MHASLENELQVCGNLTQASKDSATSGTLIQPYVSYKSIGNQAIKPYNKTRYGVFCWAIR